MWVADCAAIVSNDEWDGLRSKGDLLNFAQFISGLLIGDAVKGETTLGVVEQSEALVGLLDLDDIHESGWEVSVSSDLSVNLNQTLHQNHGNLLLGKSVLQAVTQQEDQWETFAELVWSWAWSWGLKNVRS